MQMGFLYEILRRTTAYRFNDLPICQLTIVKASEIFLSIISLTI